MLVSLYCVYFLSVSVMWSVCGDSVIFFWPVFQVIVGVYVDTRKRETGSTIFMWPQKPEKKSVFLR